MANLAILTTPKEVLPTFTMAADRYYWAKPRQVETVKYIANWVGLLLLDVLLLALAWQGLKAIARVIA